MLALLALVWLVTEPVAAQCTVRGAATVERATLHDDVILAAVALPDVEIDWPAATTARLRSPFDAPVVVEGVPFRLAETACLPSAFFEGEVLEAAVEQRGGATLLHAGFVEITGVSLRCDDVALGAVSGPSAFEDGGPGPLGTYSTLAGGVDLRAAPRDDAPSIHVGGENRAPLGLRIVERRGDWARIERVLGRATVHGWVRANPEREGWGSGAGGFRGRPASVPRARTPDDASPSAGSASSNRAASSISCPRSTPSSLRRSARAGPRVRRSASPATVRPSRSRGAVRDAARAGCEASACRL